MPSYKAPVRDMQFLLHDVFNVADFCQQFPAYQEVDKEIIDSILEEAAKFAENELHPINQSGDIEGTQFNNGEVTTPKGFKQAYQHFVEQGWMSLNSDPEYGGQGLPKFLQLMLDEMLCSSNVSFSLYTVLTQGTYHVLHKYASDAIKKIYLPKLVSGEWSGSMCLTEPHCGSDLGLLRTKAVPQADGSYKLTGTKIFITSGEHDLTENIIHTVIARMPDAPEGVKGISLFMVPKFLVNNDGSLGKRNSVHCGSIEHKMGIKASSTCVLNFEDATGYLIGEPNKGMQTMFAMMNMERLNIGLEGLGLAEIAYQNALAYAKERLQGRASKKYQDNDKAADPILFHPDVRRMLLDIKVLNEAARALAVWTAIQIDIYKNAQDQASQEKADNFVALFTPIIKAFFTDYGFSACNQALQVLGGHGYVKEWGMEQFVRDARIAQIYEGTNGIQALDLVKRKLIANKGESVDQLSEVISEFLSEHHENEALTEFTEPLETCLKTMVDTSYWIITQSKENPDIIGSSSTDYLHMMGYTLLGFMWIKMAMVAQQKLAQDPANKFYQAKVHAARYYFERILPQVNTLQETIQAGSNIMMDLELEHF